MENLKTGQEKELENPVSQWASTFQSSVAPTKQLAHWSAIFMSFQLTTLLLWLILLGQQATKIPRSLAQKQIVLVLCNQTWVHTVVKICLIYYGLLYLCCEQCMIKSQEKVLMCRSVAWADSQ